MSQQEPDNRVTFDHPNDPQGAIMLVTSGKVTTSQHAQMSAFAERIYKQKYAHEVNGRKENWEETAERVVKSVMAPYISRLGDGQKLLNRMITLIGERKVMPGGRYLYSSGRKYPQINSCFLFRAEDSREGWADLMSKCTNALMTGGGIGVVYSKLREDGAIIAGMGGKSTGPVALMQMVNEAGRYIVQGGSRRSAIWAGLHWAHRDVFKFMAVKDWPEHVRQRKEIDFNSSAPLDGTNISVILDDEFFSAYSDPSHPKNFLAQDVYWTAVRSMLRTGEPGFSVDIGDNNGENLRNACTEVTSSDDCDMCNLSSLNLAKYDNYDEFAEDINTVTAFLLCGTLYSKLPIEQMYRVREKNRRLGLGLMGIHEWLLLRGRRYAPDAELEKWLQAYAMSGSYANLYADRLGISRPVATRSVAPTGCQRLDTMVVTSDGVLELQELGDPDGEKWQGLNTVVFTDRGQALSTKFFNNGVARTIKVSMSSRVDLECTPNHQYRCLRNGEYQWVRADHLKSGDKLVVRLGGYEKEEEPGMAEVAEQPGKRGCRQQPVKQPAVMSPELAWFIGVYHANGSNHAKGIRINMNAYQDKWKKVIEVGKSLFGWEATTSSDRGCLAVYFSSQQIKIWLEVNGLLKNRSSRATVPYLIRVAGRKSLESFVSGYFYGDGTVTSTGVRSMATASYRMAMQMAVIIRALGNDVSCDSYVSGKGSLIHRVRIVSTHRRDETVEDRLILERYGLRSCTVDTVLSLQEGECHTADIEVPAGNTYVANGVVSHNTISIIAETTSGIEPVYAVAYRRRYLDGKVWKAEYVIDTTAKNIINKGVDPALIEDSMVLAEDVERRIHFQGWCQKYIDHGVASTINIPPWGSDLNNERGVTKFGNLLFNHLPSLRGITTYPDGSRGGQPITRVPFEEALNKAGTVYIDNSESACKSGVCSS